MDIDENCMDENAVVNSPPPPHSQLICKEENDDPRALDCLKFIKPLENDDFREKCGEIFVENGKYTLQCKFCYEDYDSLEIFIEHMVEHLVPCTEALDTDASSDCKTEPEDENDGEIEDDKNLVDEKILIPKFKFKFNNQPKWNNFQRNFDLKRNPLNFRFQSKYDTFSNNRSVPPTRYPNFQNRLLNRNYGVGGGNENIPRNFDEDATNGNDGNTIECVPDLGGMLYDIDNSAEGNPPNNSIRSQQNSSETHWNGYNRPQLSQLQQVTILHKSSDGRFYCNLCDKSYQYSKSLKEHIELQHSTREKTFKCPTCDKAFTKQWKLNTHLKVHSDERPYICNICVMTFKWKKNLSRHLIRVHNVKLSDIRPEDYHLDLITSSRPEEPQLQEEDSESFSETLFKNSLRENRNAGDFPIIKNLLTDNPKKSLDITRLPTPSEDEVPLTNHSIKQEKPDIEDENYDYMDDSMIPLEDLDPSRQGKALEQPSSVKTGTNDISLQPDINGQDEFPENNITRVKPEPLEEDFYNQDENKDMEMDQMFEDDQSLDSAQKPNSPSPLPFKSPNQLRPPGSAFRPPGAPLVPNKDGFYSCRTCSKVYLRKDSLRAHERIHSAGLSCDFCGKNFSHRYFLERHVRTHTGEKPFRCHLCNAAFVEENSLRNHIKFHIGDKRFCCQFCPKRFIKQYEKIEHERNAHNNQVPPYNCDFCSKVFNHIKSLRFHRKICKLNPDANKSTSSFPNANEDRNTEKNVSAGQSTDNRKSESPKENNSQSKEKENFEREDRDKIKTPPKKEFSSKEQTREPVIKETNASQNTHQEKELKVKQPAMLQPIPIDKLQNSKPNTETAKPAERAPPSNDLTLPRPEDIKKEVMHNPHSDDQKQVLLQQTLSYEKLQKPLIDNNLSQQQMHHHQQLQQHLQQRPDMPRHVILQHRTLENHREAMLARPQHLGDRPLHPALQQHPSQLHQQHHPHLPHLQQQHIHHPGAPPPPHPAQHPNPHSTPHPSPRPTPLPSPHTVNPGGHPPPSGSAPAQQFSAQHNLHHNPHHHPHQYQLAAAHSLDYRQPPSASEQLSVEPTSYHPQHQLHYQNIQHQYAAAAAAHLQTPPSQIQIQQYHPQQFNFQSHSQYLSAAAAAAGHPQAYYSQQYQQYQQHQAAAAAAAHLQQQQQHPQQYEPQPHLANQIAYVHDSFS